MSEIRVGDLVMVVVPGCTHRNLGFIFTVTDITGERSECAKCNQMHGSGRSIYPDRPFPSGWGYRIAESRLRRIPPLSELESTEHKEETPA